MTESAAYCRSVGLRAVTNHGGKVGGIYSRHSGNITTCGFSGIKKVVSLLLPQKASSLRDSHVMSDSEQCAGGCYEENHGALEEQTVETSNLVLGDQEWLSGREGGV